MDAAQREKHAAISLQRFTRELSGASNWHWFPLIWIDLVSVVYLSTRITSSDLSRFLLVTLLLVLHADLYFLGTRAALKRRCLAYLIAQGLLLVMISLLAHDWGISLGLYGALAIKTVELLDQAEPDIGPAPGYVNLCVSGLCLILLQPGGSVDWFALSPLVICSGGAVLLFLRQTRTSQRMQRLLRDLETAHRELYIAHTELTGEHAQLAASMVEIEEITLASERQRFARELHDTLAQSLVSLVWQLEAIDSRLADEQPQRAREIVQQAMQRARTTLTETRSVIHDLRAENSGQDSLVEIVRAELRRFSQVTGITCRSDLRQLETLPAPLHEPMLQAMKESLTNVARHAHAREVWLSVRNSGRAFDLEIRDDGRGFDSRHIVAGHYGLLGLRERAQQLGGELEVQSAPGEGTRVRMRLPHMQEELVELCI